MRSNVVHSNVRYLGLMSLMMPLTSKWTSHAYGHMSGCWNTCRMCDERTLTKQHPSKPVHFTSVQCLCVCIWGKSRTSSRHSTIIFFVTWYVIQCLYMTIHTPADVDATVKPSKYCQCHHYHVHHMKRDNVNIPSNVCMYVCKNVTICWYPCVSNDSLDVVLVFATPTWNLLHHMLVVHLFNLWFDADVVVIPSNANYSKWRIKDIFVVMIMSLFIDIGIRLSEMDTRP